MSEFERALAKVLAHEGGYVNHLADPGGATNKGVTQAVYDAFRRSRNLPTQTVRAITAGEIEAIYRSRYWDLMKGDQMPAGVGYVVFDGAVNSGVAQSVKWLQRALGPAYKGVVDGLVGPGTLAAVAAHPNHDSLIAAISAQRLAFLKALRTWPVFGRGWTARVADVQRTGQAWATGAVTPPAQFVFGDDGVSAKAPPTDVAAAPPVAPGDVAASGGGVAAIIAQTIGQLSPLQGIPSVANIVMWLTIAGAAIAIGGILYRFWAARRKAEIRQATA